MLNIDVEERAGGVSVEIGSRVQNVGSSGYSFSEDFRVTGSSVELIKADAAEQDNTHPITSAAVYAEIGNIGALLETI